MKRGAVVGVVAGGLVLVVGGGLAWWFLSRPPGPEATAQSYLAALAAGDGSRALALSEAPASEADIAAMFDGATSYLVDPSVTSVGSAEGEPTRAEVTFTLDGEARTASFGLVEQDGVWKVAADALGSAAAETTLGDSVLIGGVRVLAASDVALLPAVYAVDAAPAGILVGSTTAVVLPGASTPAVVEASLSPDATTLAQEQLDAYAAACAAPAPTVPANCGLRVPWAADLANLDGVAYRIEQTPQAVLAPDLTTFDATGGVIVATATGTTRDGATASFTYRADDWAMRGAIVLTDGGMQLAVG